MDKLQGLNLTTKLPARPCLAGSCASGWDRTNDLVLKRDLLYQLSYGRKYLKTL